MAYFNTTLQLTILDVLLRQFRLEHLLFSIQVCLLFLVFSLLVAEPRDLLVEERLLLIQLDTAS